jgi:hypothetical protein
VSKLADFKEMSATGLQYAIQQQNVMDLNIELQAPYIIVPHGGFYSGYVRWHFLVPTLYTTPFAERKSCI